ncbi:SIMPL domain-containing protein [Flavobacterium sp.]|uniref:SIMPL domain-containing protein n=1 Tax=Flavobacterium sp. TaxID=239 RepID=UPI003341DED1
MKKVIVIAFAVFSSLVQAQEKTQIPQISVSGEGKISVKPDQVVINFGIENIGKDATEVKKLNDETVDKTLKFIKEFGILSNDYKTTDVSLNRNYDYEKKKYNYRASQSVTIILKNLSRYDSLMMGLVDNGINSISNVEFKTSKLEEYKSEARKLAMKEAQHKAEDYVSVLNQKIGKAITINDNTQTYFPQPMYRMAMADKEISGNSVPKETIAVGEIEVVATVSVSFILE